MAGGTAALADAREATGAPLLGASSHPIASTTPSHGTHLSIRWLQFRPAWVKPFMLLLVPRSPADGTC